jgi:hypothetical protein
MAKAAKKVQGKKATKATGKKATPKATKKGAVPTVTTGPGTAMVLAETRAITTTRKQDNRMPPVGTKLAVNRGGKVVEAKVTAEGIVYNGTTYKSPSGAARAACQDLKLSDSVNGWSWWGIVKPAPVDPIGTCEKAWARITATVATMDDATRTALYKRVPALFGKN